MANSRGITYPLNTLLENPQHDTGAKKKKDDERKSEHAKEISVLTLLMNQNKLTYLSKKKNKSSPRTALCACSFWQHLLFDLLRASSIPMYIGVFSNLPEKSLIYSKRLRNVYRAQKTQERKKVSRDGDEIRTYVFFAHTASNLVVES